VFDKFVDSIRKNYKELTPIVCDKLSQDDGKRRCPDITKAKRVLKWEPKVGLEEGLKLTLAYFKEVFNRK
jgi:nucleoside-diphosphate-sugar epimerase